MSRIRSSRQAAFTVQYLLNNGHAEAMVALYEKAGDQLPNDRDVLALTRSFVVRAEQAWSQLSRAPKAER